MKRREHWLKSIIEWQNEFLGSLTAQEFVDGITGDVLGRGVFVFTPNGEIMRLPKVSQPVQAYLAPRVATFSPFSAASSGLADKSYSKHIS